MPETQEKTPLRKIVARIVVAVMFGMLIVSFGIWGIGDVFRRGGRLTPVAEVGPVRIMPQEFQDQYRRELRRLQTVLQTEFDAQHARELGVPQRVIEDMIGRVLFDLAARDANVAIGDETVRQSIVDNPQFRNAQGEFDRNIFQGILYNANYTEDRFVAMLRQDLARGQVTDAVAAGAAAPKALVDHLYRYRNERRVADALLVSAASITDVPTPTDAELDAYRTEHANAFTAPEYRAITAVEIHPADLAADIKVPEDRLKDEYEARIGEFRMPEERTLRQILVPDEATAKKAAELIAGGEAFEKVAQDVTGKAPLDLGTVKESDVASPELGRAAFEASEGSATAPVQSPLGWHIVQVEKVVEGRTQTLDEVKDKLTHDIAMREASDTVFDVGNKLQDALGGGASLEEAAEHLKLKVQKFNAVDGNGNDPDGKPVDDLAKLPKLLSTAFSSQTGRVSDLVDDGQNGYFILRVDNVVSSQLRPLAEVREKVLAAVKDEEKGKAAGKVATTILEKVRVGGDLQKIAKEGGYTFATSKPFTRTAEGAAAGMTPELIAALFGAKVGDATMAATPQGAMVAKLVSTVPADPTADEAGVKRLHDQIVGAIGGDLLNDFADALRAKYGVEVNQSVLESMIGS
jgi:peptidyl-prolyl cis-trans isomerase D